MRSRGIGKTKTFGNDPNAFDWGITDGTGKNFERAILNKLRKHLASFDDSVCVQQSKYTDDEGRDIEITYSRPIEIAGRRLLVPEGKSRGTIFVECKSTTANRLSESFLSDASQHEADQYDAYVLITNATLTPSVHYNAQRIWERIGAQFILVDKARLWGWLFSDHLPGIGALDTLLPEPSVCSRLLEKAGNGLVVHILNRKQPRQREHRVSSYVVVRNYGSESRLFSLTSVAEITWDSDIELSDRIQAGEDKVYRFELKQQVFGIDSEISISLKTEERSTYLTIQGPKIDLVLDPPFFGARHSVVRRKVESQVSTNRSFKVISVEGEAGVGKTRTIKEALAPLTKGRAGVVWLACNPDTSEFDYAPVWELLNDRDIDVQLLASGGQHTSYDALSAIARQQEPLVIVLEDLHHCSTEEIQGLKRLITAPPKPISPLALLVTGRNDFTFPNPDYFSFLELLHMNSEAASCFKLEPLTDNESHDFINAIVKDIPRTGLNKIHKLGQCNPFIILETLQYLLDVELARLLTRHTISVVDPEKFAGARGLPRKVQDLFQRRLDALEKADGGPTALHLLCLLSLMGGNSPLHMLDEFFFDESRSEILALLRQRRFLVFQPDKGLMSFFHENIISSVRKWLNDRASDPSVARRLLDYPLSSHLPRFQYGLLLALAREYDAAMDKFMPIWYRVQATTNFSSEEIPREYYHYLPVMFEVALRKKEKCTALMRVALTMGYMGVHNFPLYEGEKACSIALGWIDRINESDRFKKHNKRNIRQLRAHALQNMGQVSEALRIMLEIKAEIDVERKKVTSCQAGDKEYSDPALEYDLYDRLQEHYRRVNHRALMNDYGRLAERAVKDSADEKLLSSHLITQSLAKIHNGRKSAVAAAEKAILSSLKVGVQRFVVFNELTFLIVRTIYAKDALESLPKIFEHGKRLLKKAIINNYSDSIIRLELLLATLCLQIYENSLEGQRVALNYIRAGKEASVRYGIGSYGWALENLEAVILLEQAKVPNNKIEHTFDACLDHLQHRNLLFVGCEDGTYPSVFAIANLVRYRASHTGEKEAQRIITGHVTSYSMKHKAKSDIAHKLVVAARSGAPIFWRKGKVLMPRYPQGNGYFTPIF